MTQAVLSSATQAILFDHDGTLIDSETSHYELWHRLLQGHGVELSRAFYNDTMAGIPVAQEAEDLVHQFGLSVRAAVLAEQKHQATRQFLQQQAFALMPDATATLQRCAGAGYRLAIVTGGSRLAVERTLSCYGLHHLIETVVAAEDVRQGKPAPECYQLALSQMQLTPQQAVAVEDTMHGVQAARAAQLACVAIPGPNSQNHDFSQASVQHRSLAAWLACEWPAKH